MHVLRLAWRGILRATIRFRLPILRKLRKVFGLGALKPSDVSDFISAVRASGVSDPVLLDVGSRHGLEAIEFTRAFPRSRIYCFEPNPEAFTDLEANVSAFSQITPVQAAVSGQDGPVEFHAIDAKRTLTPHVDGNLGASSLYEPISEYPHEIYATKKIVVESIRFDTFLRANGVERVDAIWMDVQGAELAALQTLPDEMYAALSVLQVELQNKEMYFGAAKAEETINFLRSKGMKLVTEKKNDWFGDYIFTRESDS